MKFVDNDHDDDDGSVFVPSTNPYPRDGHET